MHSYESFASFFCLRFRCKLKVYGLHLSFIVICRGRFKELYEYYYKCTTFSVSYSYTLVIVLNLCLYKSYFYRILPIHLNQFFQMLQDLRWEL